MRYVFAVLVVMLVALQYRLWFAEGGMRDASRLRDSLARQQEEIVRLKERNQILQAEVIDLKSGLQAVEESARSELGMIKEGETFFRVIETPGDGSVETDQ